MTFGQKNGKYGNGCKGLSEKIFKSKAWDLRKIWGKEALNLGFMELIIILIIVFFVFGGRKIPELSKALGSSVRNLKKGLHDPETIDITPQGKEAPLPEEKRSKKT